MKGMIGDVGTIPLGLICAAILGLILFNFIGDAGRQAAAEDSNRFDLLLNTFESLSKDMSRDVDVISIALLDKETVVVFESSASSTAPSVNGIAKIDHRACRNAQTCICGCVDAECNNVIDCRVIWHTDRVIARNDVGSGPERNLPYSDGTTPTRHFFLRGEGESTRLQFQLTKIDGTIYVEPLER